MELSSSKLKKILIFQERTCKARKTGISVKKVLPKFWDDC